MDEIGVMLSMPGSVKVLVGKDDRRKYRGARVKRTAVTAIFPRKSPQGNRQEGRSGAREKENRGSGGEVGEKVFEVTEVSAHLEVLEVEAVGGGGDGGVWRWKEEGVLVSGFLGRGAVLFGDIGTAVCCLEGDGSGGGE